MNVEIDETYTFKVTESTVPDYKMCASISQWIHNNLENLTDDDNHKIFNKVNYGFNENILKTFGKKPVADVYVNNIDYDSDFELCRPVSVHSIIVFYVKGANDVAYIKICELHDYIMQQFIENDDWKELTGVVRNTVVTNSQVMNQPIQKKWGVMGAFELRHDLY